MATSLRLGFELGYSPSHGGTQLRSQAGIIALSIEWKVIKDCLKQKNERREERNKTRTRQAKKEGGRSK